MRLLLHIALVLLVQPCAAQADTLLTKERIDLRAQELWETISDQGKLITEYQYLDSLDFFSITYASDGHIVKGYIMEPKTQGEYPIIIFNRGGNRDFASLKLGTLLDYTSKLAEDGYLIIASNYRKEDEFGGAEINDVLKLIDLCPNLEKADTSRIGMFGWSRGGMMCYLAMARTTRLKTVVVGNGPTDLEQTLIERPMIDKNVFGECIPNYENDKPGELQKRSVIQWPEKLCTSTSLLILAGTLDNHVSYTQATTLAERLSETSLIFELKTYETNHFFSGKKAELNLELLNWFERELKNP